MQTVDHNPSQQPSNRYFDPLSYARRLQSGGFSREQAETLAEEQAKLIDERIASKADVDSVRTDIKAAIESLTITTNADLRELELRLHGQIKEFELGLHGQIKQVELGLQSQIKDSIIKMGGMNFALGGILIAIKYFG